MWACDKYLVTLFVLTCFVISISSGKITNKIVKEVEKMRSAKVWNEDACLAQGGICFQKEECPEGSLAPEGLCPEQQQNGVECCYGLPISETDCNKRGGQCLSKGKCGVIIQEPTNCNSNEDCCALVS